MSKDEFYSRQSILPQIGTLGQQKLANASVLVIGAGGLGVPVLQLLASMGVGHIGIADYDTVSISNLHRQYIYKHEEIGKFKSHLAKKYVELLNPFIKTYSHCTVVDEHNIVELIAPYHVVIDCTDNFSTRYLINDACVVSDKILVYGSVFQFEGNVSVFNLFNDSPTLRCLFPDQNDAIPTCETAGIMANATTLTATYMATEVLKIILDLPAILDGKLLVVNALHAQNTIFEFQPNPQNRQLSFDFFTQKNVSYTISVAEFEKIIHQDIQVVDVRTLQEHQLCNLGGILIPMDELESQYHILDRNKPTVVYCHHGVRSQYALEFLQSQGFKDIRSLDGGIHQYAISIDSTIAVY